MEGSDTPPPEEGTPEARAPLTPMRRSVRKRTESEPVSPDDSHIAGAIALLSSLYAQSKGGEGAESATPERTQSLLQAKRLSRSGGGTAGDAGPTPATEPGARPESTGPGGGAALGKMTPRMARPPRRRAWSPVLVWGVAAGIALLGFGVIWYWPGGKPGTPDSAATPEAANSAPSRPPGDLSVSDEALRVADEVLVAMEKRDDAGAVALLEEADRRKLFLPGLRYQMGLLAYRQHDSDKARHWLNASIDAGELRPECAYLLAADMATRNDYPAAAAQMRTAARLTPFSPRYSFFWAECLRRAGKPIEAIEHFEQARRCRPSSGDLELILFKLNLARIEAGNDPEFQADVAKKLTVEPVSGNLLLIGAANEISHYHYAAATPYLQRAAQALPPGVMQARMRDYLFRPPTNDPALAAEWAALVPAPAAPAPGEPSTPSPLVDPATRGLVDADPAGW